MAWTHEAKVAYLMTLPWTLVAETTPEGDRLVRVLEIPSAVGSGSAEAEIAADFWASLRASLVAYLHFGDPIPLPAVVRTLPWDANEPARPMRYVVVARPRVSGESLQEERERTTVGVSVPFQHGFISA